MRLLLDTHTFLWWLDGDRRLVKAAREDIAGEGNVVLVSNDHIYDDYGVSRICC